MKNEHKLANQFRYFLCVILFINLIYSQSEQPYPPLDLVTVPTSGTLPKGSYTLEALLMNDRGILSKISVGISERISSPKSTSPMRECSKPTSPVGGGSKLQMCSALVSERLGWRCRILILPIFLKKHVRTKMC